MIEVKRVTLVGCMGSGKTTLSQLLAERWNWRALDLDRVIELQAPARLALDDADPVSISTLFDTYGEGTFRRLERDCLDDVLGESEVIIATGGGTPALEGAMTKILAAGPAVWLDGDLDVLLDRARTESNRPLLAGLSRTEAQEVHTALAAARRCHYDRASARVDVSDGEPREVADRVEAALVALGEGPWSR